MSTTQRHQAEVLFTGGTTVALDAVWTAFDGTRVVWSLSVALTAQGPRPLRAEAVAELKGQTRSVVAAAPDDVELTEDPDRSMLHAQVRASGEDMLKATFRKTEQGWTLVYASTPLLAKLGLRGGRYELGQ